MLQPTSTPEIRTRDDDPSASYGDLMANALLQVQAAASLSFSTREPQVAHDELLGYQRFLRAAGEHLALLMRLGHERPEGMRQLSVRLAAVPRREQNSSRWSQAALTIGAAHDLIATHLDGRLLPASPDAEDISDGEGTALAIRRLTGMVLKGARATQQLMRTAGDTQTRRQDFAIPGPLFREVADTNHRILLNAKAALWDLDNEIPAPAASTLSHVRTLTQPSSPSFDSALAALRALRQLSYDQARGRAPASTASLHDLARLGAAVTDPTRSWVTETTSGVDRLRAAHAADQLAVAHQAWTLAGQDLTRTVQGTTKAPRSYESAIARITDDLPLLTRPVRLAILSTLPRLGHEAGHTIRRLESTNALVHRRRDLTELSASWHPIRPAHGHELTQRFDAAAEATTPAVATLSHITMSTILARTAVPAVEPLAATRPQDAPSRGMSR